MTFVYSAAALIVAALIALVALVWWQQERIVFQPPGLSGASERPDVRRVEYRAADGQPLFGYLVRPAEVTATTAAARRRELESRESRESPAGVLLAFHGNADLAGWGVPWAQQVARRTGWTVFLAEYRGYDGLPGVPTYDGTKLDARAAYAFVRDSLGAQPHEVALFGHSLGSAIATELATEVSPAALLLQSPFTSARAMARFIITPPVVAVAWRVIARVHYDTEARVRAFDVPVHVAHGDRDLVVPVRMGRLVHAAAHVPGGLLIAHGRGHNDVPSVGDAYWTWMAGALNGSGGRRAVSGVAVTQ